MKEKGFRSFERL